MAYAGFRILNAIDASYYGQAQAFSQDFQIMAEGIRGNGVLSGCAVSAQSTPDGTVHVAAGTVAFNGATVVVTAADVAVAAGHPTLARIDVVTVDDTGTVIIALGIAAVRPIPAAVPQSSGTNNVVLAFVYRPAAALTVTAAMIVDHRVFVPSTSGGPLSGSGVAGQFAIWSGTTGLTAFSNFTWDGTTLTLAATDELVMDGLNNTSIGNRNVLGTADTQVMGEQIDMTGASSAQAIGNRITIGTGDVQAIGERLNAGVGSSMLLIGQNIDLSAGGLNIDGSSSMILGMGGIAVTITGVLVALSVDLQLFGDTTGAGTASSLGTNCPAATLTGPYTWLKFLSSDGSTVYVPAYK